MSSMIQPQLLRRMTVRKDLVHASVFGIAVDWQGNVFASASATDGGSGLALQQVDPSGQVRTIAYQHEGEPLDLAVGVDDGVLYVLDRTSGVVGIEGVTSIAPVSDPGPPPATPVPGSASFTG